MTKTQDVLAKYYSNFITFKWKAYDNAHLHWDFGDILNFLNYN